MEKVVLVDETGTAIGDADKATVHTTDTPLHLAFSCHVYNADGQILVTRRSLQKKAWPGVWTNSFCGHPAPGEALTDAVHRRALAELGVTVHDVRSVAPDFRYRAVDASGVVENEVCPVFRAKTSETLAPASSEVAEFVWVDPAELRASVTATPWAFSPWLVLQLPLFSD